MAASELADIYNFEDAIESAFATALEDEGLTVFTQRSTSELTTPRVELRCELGGTTDQFAADADGVLQLSTWAFTLRATVVTNRLENNSSHATDRARLRSLLVAFSTWTAVNAALDYIVVSRNTIEELATQYNVNTEEDQDASALSFNGLLRIRDDAWPESE